MLKMITEEDLKILITEKELQNKIAELDKTIGFENIRVIADVTYNVEITVDEIKVDTTESNPSEP